MVEQVRLGILAGIVDSARDQRAVRHRNSRQHACRKRHVNLLEFIARAGFLRLVVALDHGAVVGCELAGRMALRREHRDELRSNERGAADDDDLHADPPHASPVRGSERPCP